MPLTTSAANWEVGIHKQTNEATPGTVADYAFPVFSGSPRPVQSVNAVQVTDAATIVGDPYKNPDEHWEADIVIPAFADAMGTMLQSLWPTDTATGSVPGKIHTFSGLGSANSWVSMYSNALGSLQETFGKGQCSGIGFSFDQTGGPLRINYKAVGQVPSVANYTKTVTDTLAAGYFTAVGGVLKYEADNATPVAATNIQAATVTVDFPITPVPTADGITVTNLARSFVDPKFTLSMLYTDFEMYRATYYGAVGGSAASNTIVKGSVELNFVHTVTGTWSFKLTIPSAVFVADPIAPDPGGSPAIVTVNGWATKPGSGDHVQPVLVNSVNTAY